jgi:hypothetical protein
MRIGIILLTLWLQAAPGLRPQDADQGGSVPPASEQAPAPRDKPAPKRPSLGPAPAPTLGSPRTASITDARRLIRVKKVYVERMENGLHEKLIASLGKIKRFRMVGDYAEADAVLRGSCLDMRRLKTLKTDIFLNEIKGASLWQDTIRRPINPPTVDVAAAETAEIIAAHLAESIIEAERR